VRYGRVRSTQATVPVTVATTNFSPPIASSADTKDNPQCTQLDATEHRTNIVNLIDCGETTVGTLQSVGWTATAAD
jgi:hypothetical protein